MPHEFGDEIERMVKKKKNCERNSRRCVSKILKDVMSVIFPPTETGGGLRLMDPAVIYGLSAFGQCFIIVSPWLFVHRVQMANVLLLVTIDSLLCLASDSMRSHFDADSNHCRRDH